MRHNELIKKLRHERCLSQAELTNGICSRNALSTFETDGSKMSFESCFAFCEKMNITLEEYEYQFHDGNMSGKRIISRKVKEAFNTSYSSELSNELLEKYAATNDFYYYSLYAQYYLLSNLNTEQLRSNTAIRIAKKVKRYLDAVDVWGRFELVLFNNCMFMFESKYIAFQFHESVKLMRVYSDSASYSADLLAFLVNGTQLMYERKAKIELDIFLAELQAVARKSSDYRALLASRVFSFLQQSYSLNKTDEAEKARLLAVLQFFDNQNWYQLVSDVR